MYFAYARSTTTCDAERRAPSTSRLKPSFSTWPGEDAANASSKIAGHRVEIEGLVVGDQAEVVDPDRVSARRGDAVRAFLEHAHAHVLEHRQAVGDRDRHRPMEQLEAQRPGRSFERPVQVHAERAVGERARRHLDVGDRVARAAPPRGSRRETRGRTAGTVRFPGASPRRSISAALRSSSQRRAGLVEPALELGHVDVRDLPGRRAHGDQHAHQRRLGEAHVEFRRGARVRLHQDRLPFLAQVGRVAVARRVDQTGHETLESIAADEQPEALAHAEPEDPHRLLEQVVFADLHQLVARIGVQDVLELLRRVASRRQPGAGAHVGDLAPEHRDFSRCRPVCRVRVQTDEAVLAADLAVGVVALDADVVEVAGAMHGRTRVRLGDDQDVLDARVAARRPRQRGEAARHLGLLLAQNAQARARHQPQRVAAVIRHEVVAAVAEQREMVGGQPLEERLRLRDFLGGQRRRLARQVDRRAGEPCEQRLPILDGDAHVAQHAQQVTAQRIERRRIADAVDLDVHHRLAGTRAGLSDLHVLALVRAARRWSALDAHRRMDDQVQSEPVAVDLHRDRIDEERHVVVDDLDDRVR